MKNLENGPSAYAKLAEALRGAYNQASEGKGRERHATDEPFEEQKICVISRWIADSPIAGVLFQAVKKAVESARLPSERAIRELQGAINYLAAGIILLEEGRESNLFRYLEQTLSENERRQKEELDKDLFKTSNAFGHVEYKRYVRSAPPFEMPEGWGVCLDCIHRNVPQHCIPCKKCFNLPFRPHFDDGKED
jgi:hypothetical protein